MIAAWHPFGFAVDVSGSPSPAGAVLHVRVSLPGFEPRGDGSLAEVHMLADGTDGTEHARRTPLGRAALEVARAQMDGGLAAVRAAETRALAGAEARTEEVERG